MEHQEKSTKSATYKGHERTQGFRGRKALLFGLALALLSLSGVMALRFALGSAAPSMLATLRARLGQAEGRVGQASNLRATPATPDEALQAQVSQAYGKLPLSFEVNQGQTDAGVKFLSRGNGYNLFLTPTEAVLTLSKPAAHKASKTPSPSRLARADQGTKPVRDVLR